jgi:hypothetical protein
MAIDRLTIEDYSDREFLLIVRDVCAESSDGWTEAEEVAERMGLRHKRLASSRLSWLRRYGAVEKEIERDEAGNIRAARDGKIRYTQRWRLTQLGLSMAVGKLSKTNRAMLEGLDEGKLLMAVRLITERTQEQTGASKLVQREWRYGHARGR